MAFSTAFAFRNARLPSSSSSFSSSPPPSRAFSPPRASIADPYSTLGVPFGASEEQIKKARRKLALKVTPLFGFPPNLVSTVPHSLFSSVLFPPFGLERLSFLLWLSLIFTFFGSAILYYFLR
jgi:hypothetical protein